MHHDVTAFIELLLIASLVAIVLQRVRLPFTVTLVAVGMVLGALDVVHGVHISPDLVLTIFLPGLLFESAQHIHLRDFLKDAQVILTLAVPGVLVSIILTGVGVYFGLRWLGHGTTVSFPIACLLGVMVAATDPISVIGLFRSLKVNERLSLLLEGESLFNDGTAIVFFGIVLHLAAGGSLSVAEGLREFTLVAFGGAAIGLVAGFTVERLLRTTSDHLVEIGLTVVLAYGVFLFAERVHVSGVIAVVVAGMVNGNLGVHSGLNAFSRVALFSFWEFAAFVINSMVFLIMGIDVHLGELWADGGAILVGFISMLAARAIGIYLLTPLAGRFVRDPIPFSWHHVLYWGGLRGALSIVLVLSLPADFPQRTLLAHMVFGMVVLSCFGQGLTMRSVLKALGLVGAADPERESQFLRTRLQAHRAAVERLEQLRREKTVSVGSYGALLADHEAAIADLEERLEAQLDDPDAVHAERKAAERSLRESMRTTILHAYHKNEISADVADSLLHELDPVDTESH